MTNYDKALEYFRKSLNIREEIGYKLGIATNANNMGGIYTELGKYDDAFFYLSKGLNVSKEINSKEHIVYSYENFSALYEAKRDYKKALEYYKRAAEEKDTLLNEKVSKQIAEMQTRYDTLKKEKEIEVLTKNNELLHKNNELLNKNYEIQKLRLDREKMTRNAFIIGFILVLIILVLLFRKFLYLFSFWKKQKYIGRFRLVEEIGSGGMGTIYKAHTIRDKTDTAAVKVLKPELFKDETGRKRFKQEAAIIDKLDHPHIIKIIERGEYKEKFFIAMELLQGKTLDVKIDEDGQMDLNECFHIMMQISNALVLIHGKDIIHRDLKPSNIMLIQRNGDPNFVKLLDFGLATMKYQTRITRTGILVGSINYMSPEQLANSEFSSASDIYSLGVTFYEMITGRIVFPGDTSNEIIRQILDTTPIEPHRYRPDIPGELDDLIMKMLERDKESRPVIKNVFETLRMIQAKYK
jgi:tetratricopeptide (TPR) repeat protein